MKIFKNLISYHNRLYLKTNKYIMPALAWIIFLIINYSQKWDNIVSSTLVSITFIFFVMLWISMTYMESVDPVAEQIMLLKVKNCNTYYHSKNIFVFLLGAELSIVGVAYPVMKNVLSGFTFFTRQVTLWDIICTFILHILVAILGGTIGILFQPRCIKNRKEAVLGISAVAIISIAKTGINGRFIFAKYVTWIFPPLSDILAFFSNNEYFSLVSMVKALIYGCIYSAVLLFISRQLLKRKLF